MSLRDSQAAWLSETDRKSSKTGHTDEKSGKTGVFRLMTCSISDINTVDRFSLDFFKVHLGSIFMVFDNNLTVFTFCY